VHPGMPLGRKHLRRSRDAPNLWDGPCKELLPFYKKGSQALWDVSITETPVSSNGSFIPC